ncbi:MAG: DegT/DnrJ/EryC1/StrS aminotransferase family protein [Fibrobacterales bacterium]
MLNSPFNPWPSYTQEEANIVQRVLLSNKVNYWTGTEGRSFEKEFATYTDSAYAVAVANGTVALDLALIALGVSAGDEVIVTSRSFLASASAIVTAGATPVFADVDLNSQNITPESIEAVMTPKTKAVICVHLGGFPCDMDEIMGLGQKNDFYVIEDCAQAHGARYKGKSVGSIGHVGCWSFCQDKIMTTGGEGGMVTTNDETLWKKVWSYKDHGKSWDAVEAAKKSTEKGFKWLHESFGTNWRLTEIQSAIGRYQLTQMDSWHHSRLNYATQIQKKASELVGFIAIEVPQYLEHAWYKCSFNIDPQFLTRDKNRQMIQDMFIQNGVPCLTMCSELYREKAFETIGFSLSKPVPNALALDTYSIILLVHPTLTQSEIDTTLNVMEKVSNFLTK